MRSHLNTRLRCDYDQGLVWIGVIVSRFQYVLVSLNFRNRFGLVWMAWLH